MANFTNYTEKTEPVDTDLVLIYDTPAKVNKKFTFGNLWKWIAKKIVSEGISQLETTNKTIPGAINELNSKMFSNNTTSVNTGDNIDDLKIGIYFFNGITILGTDRYGILLNFSSINGAVRCQIIYTTKNIRITRSYGGSTGWTDWETK
jgi:hypothetical protein